MPKRLMIIDSYSLANRAFFALPPLTTANGQPTNAVYGMAMMLLRLLEESKPDYFVAAFDTAAPTFRHEQYQEYKGKRLKMEDTFKTQLPLIRQLLNILQIPIYEKAGYEADDIIGTFANQGAVQGLEVEIITGDRDAFQLVGPHIKVLFTKKGVTEVDRVDEEYVRNRYQLSPTQLIDLKGLMGDSSDNIPGVPGFGEKTALKYIQQFQSIEAVYVHLDQVTRERDRQLLTQYKDQALFSKYLATIVTDVDLAMDLNTCCLHHNFDRQQLLEFCREYQLNSLVKKLTGDNVTPQIQESPELSFEVRILQPNDLNELQQRAKNEKSCIIQFVTARADWMDSAWLGLGIGVANENYFYPLTPNQSLPQLLKDILTDPEICKLGFDLKKQLIIANHQEITIDGKLEDMQIAGYLGNAGVGGIDLEDLCMNYLQHSLPVYRNDRGTKFGVFNLPQFVQENVVSRIAGGRIAALRLVEPQLRKVLVESSLEALYNDVEIPLVRVLFEMEQAGIKVDPENLRLFGNNLRERQHQLETEIYALSEETFNISSPKQLGVILYEKLGLKAGKKTKTGYSTDAEALENLVDQHPIIVKLLEYRQNVKLQSTYIDSLISLIHQQSGRVHTTFNQAVTTTGRLSSTEPNLQNIPVRSEEGRMIRKAFVAKSPDYLLLAADYSQIELRVMAHFSQDSAFREAFLKGDDIHRFTAAAVHGVSLAEVTREMRDHAKAVNFGIIYGISGFGLAKNIRVSRKEADSFIEAYFTKYPGVKTYVEQLIADAQFTGEARTLLGRLRKLPDLHSRNFTLRSFAERMARNTPIQGTAADIIKVAMVKIQEKLQQRSELGKLLLQVHDELIFEVSQENWRELAKMVKIAMEGAVELTVPLAVDFKTGANWGEMTAVEIEG